MASGDDHAIENLIRGSEKLIQELVETGIPEADAARLAADIEANIQRGEMDALDALEALPSDARVAVSVSKDGMSATATFHSPPPDGRPSTWTTCAPRWTGRKSERASTGTASRTPF